MKKYLQPETSENRIVFDTNLAVVIDPNNSTDMQLSKDRNDEFEETKSEESEWTSGLW